MAGHHQWSKVKRRKGALDEKRGQLFSMLTQEIIVAAKTGGGDRDGNPRRRRVTFAAGCQVLPGEELLARISG